MNANSNINKEPKFKLGDRVSFEIEPFVGTVTGIGISLDHETQYAVKTEQYTKIAVVKNDKLLNEGELKAFEPELASAERSCCRYLSGLIGQKVVFVSRNMDRREKKQYHPSDNYPLPERGYFTISEARLGNFCILVNLDGGPGYPFTSIRQDMNAKWLELYKV